MFEGKIPATENTGSKEPMRTSVTSCSAQVQTFHDLRRWKLLFADSFLSGGDGGKDACQGDSGGPLVFMVFISPLIRKLFIGPKSDHCLGCYSLRQSSCGILLKLLDFSKLF